MEWLEFFIDREFLWWDERGKITGRWIEWVLKQKGDGKSEAQYGDDGDQPNSPDAPGAGEENTMTGSATKEIRYRY